MGRVGELHAMGDLLVCFALLNQVFCGTATEFPQPVSRSFVELAMKVASQLAWRDTRDFCQSSRSKPCLARHPFPVSISPTMNVHIAYSYKDKTIFQKSEGI
jgi:hypothetical protein